MERDNGLLAGLPFDIAKERYRKPDSRNPFEPYELPTGNGESGWDLFGRGTRALQSVVRRRRPSTLVVTHGGILSAAMYCILGVSPGLRGSGLRFAFGDACFVRTSYDPDQHLWTIREMSAQLD